MFKRAFHGLCSSLSLVNDTGGDDIFARQLKISSERQLQILASTRSQEMCTTFEVKENASKDERISGRCRY